MPEPPFSKDILHYLIEIGIWASLLALAWAARRIASSYKHELADAIDKISAKRANAVRLELDAAVEGLSQKLDTHIAEDREGFAAARSERAELKTGQEAILSQIHKRSL